MQDLSSLKGVKGVLNKFGLSPKKKLGQNFLLDRNILNKIVDSLEPHVEEYIVEIGPGLGVLTQELAEYYAGVLAIDIDTSLEPLLRQLYCEKNNIKFKFADVLETNVEQELKNAFYLTENKQYKVCANIPYNITTPIIFHLLENCPNMVSATLMMQKEVANRLLAAPGNKTFGRLTLTTGYYAKVEPMMNVSHHCFFPQPEVDSMVVKITPYQHKPFLACDEEMLHNLLRLSFQKRRKTMLNICSEFFGLDKKIITANFAQIGLDTKLRPENLSIEKYVLLINLFYSIIK